MGVRTQTRPADWHTGIHLLGAPRGRRIAVAAAADLRRIGATDFGTAKLNFGRLCHLPEVRAYQCGRVGGGSGIVVPGVSRPPPDGEVFDPGLNGPGLVGPGAVLGGRVTPDGKGAPKRRGQ